MYLAISTAITRIDRVSGGTNPSDFIFTVKTDNAGTSNDDQITIPTRSTSFATYDVLVDWGDGTSDEITTYNDAAWTHTYPSAGEYTITMKARGENEKPKFGAVYFNNGGDRLKITRIVQWGSNEWDYISFAWRGCSNMVVNVSDTPDISKVGQQSGSANRTAKGWFAGCSLVQYTGSGQSNWTGIKDISSAFLGCEFLLEDFGDCDWSSVTAAFAAFQGCLIFNGSIPSDMSSCIDFRRMFQDAFAFNHESIESLDTSAATLFEGMFRNAYAFNRDISGFDFSSVAVTNGANNLLANSHLSVENYDALLLSLDAQALDNAFTLHAGTSRYTAGGAVAAAVASLLVKGLTITDGGTFDYESAGAAQASLPATVTAVIGFGQSNAVGVGDSSLSPSVATTDGLEYNTTNGFIQAADPFAVAVGSFEAANTGSLWPAFINAYHAESGEHPVVTNLAIGGTTIRQWTEDGPYIEEVLKYWSAMFDSFVIQGSTVNKVLFISNIGETDATSMDNGTSGYSKAVYKRQLRIMYHIARNRFMADSGNFTFGVIQTGFRCDPDVPEITSGSGYTDIQAAQEELVTELSDMVMASRLQPTYCLSGGMSDSSHYTQAAYNAIGADVGENMAGVA